MRTVASIGLALALAIPAHARTFTNADLNGGYAFEMRQDRAGINHVSLHAQGVVIADGEGNVTASRVLTLVENGSASAANPHHRFVQAGVGTYSIDANGMGTISITWSPEASYADRLGELPVTGMEAYSRTHVDATQAWDVVLHQDGFELSGPLAMTYVRDLPAPYDEWNGSWTNDEGPVQGHATPQDAAPATVSVTSTRRTR